MSRKVFAIPLVVLCISFAIVPESAALGLPGGTTTYVSQVPESPDLAAEGIIGAFRGPVSADGDGIPLQIRVFGSASEPSRDVDYEWWTAPLLGVVAQSCARFFHDVEPSNDLGVVRGKLSGNCTSHGNCVTDTNSPTSYKAQMVACSPNQDVNLVNLDYQLPPASNGALGLNCGTSVPTVNYAAGFLRGSVDIVTL